jgi:hypothetical protein
MPMSSVVDIFRTADDDEFGSLPRAVTPSAEVPTTTEAEDADAADQALQDAGGAQGRADDLETCVTTDTTRRSVNQHSKRFLCDE